MGDAPGVNCSRAVKFLPFRGRSATCFWATTDPSSAVELCRDSATAVTSTACSTAPTSRTVSRVIVWLTCNWNSEIGSAGNRRLWCPWCSGRGRYSGSCSFPDALLTARRSAFVSRFFRTTSAFGTTPPLESRTTPVTVAEESWAYAGWDSTPAIRVSNSKYGSECLLKNCVSTRKASFLPPCRDSTRTSTIRPDQVNVNHRCYSLFALASRVFIDSARISHIKPVTTESVACIAVGRRISLVCR